MNVLFVCSGNICRSPMAEVLFRDLAARDGGRDLRVSSAGTLGIVGAPASAEAIRALQELGLDLRGHRSSAVDEARLAESDLVVVMAGHHLAELATRYPALPVERRLVRAFEPGPEPTPDPVDLDDPVGEPLPVYRQQIGILRPCLEHLLEYVRRRG